MINKLPNPREQAIEILIDILSDYDNEPVEKLAEIIFDALNIEVVSKASDLSDTNKRALELYKQYHYSYGLSYEECEAKIKPELAFWQDCVYSVLNATKPQVYVENIGVKL